MLLEGVLDYFQRLGSFLLLWGLGFRGETRFKPNKFLFFLVFLIALLRLVMCKAWILSFNFLLFPFELFLQVLFILLIHVFPVHFEDLLVGSFGAKLAFLQGAIDGHADEVHGSVVSIFNFGKRFLWWNLFSFPVFLALLDNLSDRLEIESFLQLVDLLLEPRVSLYLTALDDLVLMNRGLRFGLELK